MTDQPSEYEGVQSQIASLADDVDGLERTMNQRFDGLERRFDGLERRFDGLETRVGGLETKLGELVTGLTETNSKLDKLAEEMHQGTLVMNRTLLALLDHVSDDKRHVVA